MLYALPIPLFSADSLPPRDAPHFSVDPHSLYIAASLPTLPEGTDAIVLTEEEIYTFDLQGRSSRKIYMIYKVLTQKGAEGWDNIAMTWEPWHEQRPILQARVITPDFTVHELDRKTISDAPAKAGDSAVYSDAKETRAPLPAIAPGSVVEQEIIVSENAPLFHAGVVASFYFGRLHVPVQHARLVVDAPASLPVRYQMRLMPDMKPLRTETDGRVTLVFDSGPIAPQEPAENYLPRDVAAFPEVVFSTGTSWQNVAEDYAALVDSHTGGADLKSLAAKLTKGRQAPAEKAQAITEYLNKEVRYTGIEFGEAAITPHSAGETLIRKYGDCKDKATLLVAMLRAAGIPAYVALLHAGWRLDIPADLPGMGMFDHAIAFIPRDSDSGRDIWIDATDVHSRFGQLPVSDQGRPALIARAGSNALVRIPETSSADNVIRETREFYLSENGKARVVETSTPTGLFEANFRDTYTDKQNKANRESLTSYMKGQYLAETLDRLDSSDPADFTKPFELVLESKKAGRGSTDLSSSVAAIRLESLFYNLPHELKTREIEEKDKDKSPTGKPVKPRSADYQLGAPFVAEWLYKIVPPKGFESRSLPQDVNLALGPAVLTEHFSADDKGIVNGVVRFDCVKARYTILEATEMRNKIAEIVGQEAIMINFQPVGEALIKAGRIQEALSSYRSLIAQNPASAVHHLRLANVLLEAGIGEASRREARLAVKLEPASALAEKVLGDILESDLLGRRFRTGSDYAGAAAAYAAASKLDPDDKEIVVDLAYLPEYNPEGVRYGTGSKLKEASALYKSLSSAEITRLGFQNNRPFTLFYNGQFAEARETAETLNPLPNALIVASEAAMHGAKAGISEATKRSSGDPQFKTMLSTAGNMLMNARIYAPAAELLQAGASGDDLARVEGLVSMLRKTTMHEHDRITNDPAGVITNMILTVFDPDVTLDKFNTLQSRNARLVMQKSSDYEREATLHTGKQVRRGLIQSGLAPDVGLDIAIHSVEPTLDGDDTLGYKAKLQILGGAKLALFIVTEEGQYKLLDSSEKPGALGLEILDRLAAHDERGARALLDWERDERHLEGGDDPLSGDAFPRLWTKGKDATEAQMKTAAAAILVLSAETSPQGIAILQDARKSAANPQKTNIDIALLAGLEKMGAYAEILSVTQELLAFNPESKRLFFAGASALCGLGRFEEATNLAQQRLKKFPDELYAPRVLISTAMARGDYRAAYNLGRKLADSGKADSNDLNNMAWETLFFVRAEGPDLETAIKASRLKQNSPGILHTLGCLYAEGNKPKEAREVLLKAMDLLNLDEPAGEYWYAFGRLAEQYGELEVAKADYQKVRKPAKVGQLPNSSYLLAQTRLTAMQSNPSAN